MRRVQNDAIHLRMVTVRGLRFAECNVTDKSIRDEMNVRPVYGHDDKIKGIIRIGNQKRTRRPNGKSCNDSLSNTYKYGTNRRRPLYLTFLQKCHKTIGNTS